MSARTTLRWTIRHVLGELPALACVSTEQAAQGDGLGRRWVCALPIGRKLDIRFGAGRSHKLRDPKFYTARTKRAVNSLTVERGPKVVPHE